MISERNKELLSKQMSEDISATEQAELREALRTDEELSDFVEAFNNHNQALLYKQQLEIIRKERAFKKKWLKISIGGLGIAALFALIWFVFFNNHPKKSVKVNLENLLPIDKQKSIDSIKQKRDTTSIAFFAPKITDSIKKDKKDPLSKNEKIAYAKGIKEDKIKDSSAIENNIPPIDEKYEAYAIAENKKIKDELFDGTRSSSMSNTSNSQDKYILALDFNKNQQYQSVIDALNGLPQEHPNYYSAMKLLGRAYFNLRQYSKAREIFNKLYQSDDVDIADWYISLTYLAQYPAKQDSFYAISNKILISKAHSYNLNTTNLLKKIRSNSK